MAMRPPLSLSDCLRAVATLAPGTGAATEQVLRLLLPHDPQGEVKVAARRAAQMPSQAQTRARGDFTLPPSAQAEKGESRAAKASRPRPQPTPRGVSRVTPLPRRPLRPPPPGIRAFEENGDVPRRKPLPLIAPGKARSILAPLAAAPALGEAIDIEALLQRITRALPIKRIPRRTIWSLRHGIQLLVDCSPALLPLADDLETVEEHLRRVVGKDRLQRLYFAGCPSRGAGSGARDGWTRWTPPAHGGVAVALTDLGCAGPIGNPEWSSPAEWSRFSDAARETGTTLVALVPYPAQRIPLSLAQRIAVVPWQEQLDAARTQRILRDARTDRRR